MKNRYLVWCPVAGQDESYALDITAPDAYEAARQWAEWFDIKSDSAAAIINGNPRIVHVRHSDGALRFIVHGELVAVYRPSMIGEF